MKTDIHFWSYLFQFCVELEMFQTKTVQKIKHISFFNNFSFGRIAIYEIMWENIVQPVRL
jgi:hypothetical protein